MPDVATWRSTPDGNTNMLRKLIIYCLVAVPLASSGWCVHAQDEPDASAGRQLSTAAIVWGIIGYTRWPEPPQALRLCLIGDSEHGGTLHGAGDGHRPEYGVDVHEAVTAEDAAEHCDVLYVGKLSPEHLTSLIKLLTGRPVLTIGEEHDFCSFGGMFCLDDRPDRKNFAANLDAISRSGLRVNPQVLRLTEQLPNHP